MDVPQHCQIAHGMMMYTRIRVHTCGILMDHSLTRTHIYLSMPSPRSLQGLGNPHAIAPAPVWDVPDYLVHVLYVCVTWSRSFCSQNEHGHHPNPTTHVSVYHTYYFCTYLHVTLVSIVDVSYSSAGSNNYVSFLYESRV